MKTEVKRIGHISALTIKHVFVAIIWITIPVFADSPDLQTARSDFDKRQAAALKSIREDYARELEKLELKLTQSRDLEAALAVRRERKQIMGELGTIQTIVDDTEGSAGGGGKWIYHTDYDFKIDRPGKNTEIAIYATGDPTADSFGTVTLTSRDQKHIEIYKWSPESFNQKPIVVDISKYVSFPGQYKISFAYEKGRSRLLVKRVELHSW